LDELYKQFALQIVLLKIETYNHRTVSAGQNLTKAFL